MHVTTLRVGSWVGSYEEEKTAIVRVDTCIVSESPIRPLIILLKSAVLLKLLLI